MQAPGKTFLQKAFSYLLFQLIPAVSIISLIILKFSGIHYASEILHILERLSKILHTCKCSVAPGESCLQKSFFYVFFCHIVVPRFHQKVQFACLLPYLCSCAHTTNSQTFFQQFSFLEQKLPPPFNMLVIKYALYYHASLEKSDYTRN